MQVVEWGWGLPPVGVWRAPCNVRPLWAARDSQTTEQQHSDVTDGDGGTETGGGLLGPD